MSICPEEEYVLLALKLVWGTARLTEPVFLNVWLKEAGFNCPCVLPLPLILSLNWSILVLIPLLLA